MIQHIGSTCGPPGIPVGADIMGYSSTSGEEQTIQYQCKPEFKQIYGQKRTCRRGKWTPRLPKCGKLFVIKITFYLIIISIEFVKHLAINQSGELIVTNYKVNYFDLKDSFGHNPNQSFESLDYISLNSSQKFSFQISYSPNARLAYIELELKFLSIIYPAYLKLNMIINSYRDCVNSFERSSNNDSVIEFKFICELKSENDYKKEAKDMSNSLTLSFEYIQKLKIKIKRISVYKLSDECGSPDVPQNARSTIDLGNNIIIYPARPERYAIWGSNSSTVHCLYEGNWDKDFELLYPKIQCPLDEFDFEHGQFKNVSFEYFEYFNNTLIAAVDSKIQFQCNNSQNSSQFYYIYCQVNREWTGDLDVCQQSGSDLFVIIVTLLSTFVLTLTLTAIIGGLVLWRKRLNKKRRLKNNLNIRYKSGSESENYIQIIGEEVSTLSNRYETIDYEAIDYVVCPPEPEIKDNRHFYMELF